MPSLRMSAVTSLSSVWTHEAVASEAMVLTNTIDNENIQLFNIRNHINSNIAYLSNLLNLASSPWYGIWLEATLEDVLHPSGLEYVDLSIPVPIVGFVPASGIYEIKRLNFTAQSPPSNLDWVGNTTKLDIAQLTQLQSNQNIQWKFSIAWTHFGNELLLFVGNNIRTLNRTPLNTAFDIRNQKLVIWAYRKPVFDNLLAVTDPNNNYSSITGNNALVDLPDEYIDLLIKMTQKKILEQIREQIPAQLEQEINVGIQSISQNLANEIQFEAQERMKSKYGPQHRPAPL